VKGLIASTVILVTSLFATPPQGTGDLLKEKLSEQKSIVLKLEPLKLKIGDKEFKSPKEYFEALEARNTEFRSYLERRQSSEMLIMDQGMIPSKFLEPQYKRYAKKLLAGLEDANKEAWDAIKDGEEKELTRKIKKAKETDTLVNLSASLLSKEEQIEVLTKVYDNGLIGDYLRSKFKSKSFCDAINDCQSRPGKSEPHNPSMRNH
jgi:hypothetical protein